MALVMIVTYGSFALMFGLAALTVALAAVGITALMSGTAATDFGGRKATATCAGIVDGFAYLGSAVQSVCLGYLTTRSWHWWPVFLIPFTIVGFIFALKIWHELPPATRLYIAQVEQKGLRGSAAVR
jgi:OPA family glycerol-3-phosphate transporter-like MFS transporter